MRDLGNSEIKCFEPIDEDLTVVRLLKRLIENGGVYIMDRESMVPFEVSSMIGYNGGILLAHER